MTRHFTLPVLFALTPALALLAGCASQQEPTLPGLANPASAYCLERGGRLEIVRDAGGEHALCHLPDGSVIEEWALFRRDHR